jgi:hypothetical protein
MFFQCALSKVFASQRTAPHTSGERSLPHLPAHLMVSSFLAPGIEEVGGGREAAERLRSGTACRLSVFGREQNDRSGSIRGSYRYCSSCT